MPRIGRQETPPAAQEVKAGLLSGYSVDIEGTVAPNSRGPLAATLKAGPGPARVHWKDGQLGRASASGLGQQYCRYWRYWRYSFPLAVTQNETAVGARGLRKVEPHWQLQ